MHAEMQLKDAVIMMGPPSDERETKSAADLPAVSQSLYVYVDDVDAHCRQARAAGATITSEPEDQFWGDPKTSSGATASTTPGTARVTTGASPST
jgi:PhnB protein